MNRSKVPGGRLCTLLRLWPSTCSKSRLVPGEFSDEGSHWCPCKPAGFPESLPKGKLVCPSIPCKCLSLLCLLLVSVCQVKQVKEPEPTKDILNPALPFTLPLPSLTVPSVFKFPPVSFLIPRGDQPRGGTIFRLSLRAPRCSQAWVSL